MERNIGREQSTVFILERVMELAQGELQGGHPAVLSCGGIFVPRPRPISPMHPLYHILNTPQSEQQSKVVSAIINQNILDEAIGKERMN